MNVPSYLLAQNVHGPRFTTLCEGAKILIMGLWQEKNVNILEDLNIIAEKLTIILNIFVTLIL